jgi:hypothetical protein
VNKNSFKPIITKTNIAIFLLVAMLVSFLVSRAMLSIAMILFGVNALWKVHPKEWLKHKWWLLGCAWWLVFALSFFWSEDKSYWLEHVQVKLPILLLPLSFVFIPAFNTKQLKIYTLAFILCLLSGVAYTAYFFFHSPEHYIEGYNFANVLPTLPKNEHIRFTLTLALGIIWLFYMLPKFQEKFLKITVGCLLLFFITALHFYAVRTGLMAFYVFIIGYLFYLLFRKKTRKIAVIFSIVFLSGSFLAFRFIPTLQNRIAHFKWSIKVFEEGKKNPNYGDIGRYISYDLGWKIIKEHPWAGVGAGDMYAAMTKAYEVNYPNVPPQLRLLPHNQFMVVMLASGVFAMLFFVAWIFYPLVELTKDRDGFFFFITWLVLLLSLLVEPALEIQYGIFVYLFFLLMQRQIMLKKIVN